MLHNADLDGRISDNAVLQIFDVLESDLGAFAERHYLFVRKYIHDYPMWSFYFCHPAGGRGSVTLSVILKAMRSRVGVTGEWHVDDEASLMRSTYQIPFDYLPSIQAAVVVASLEDVLSKLLTAPPSARSISSRIVERPKDEHGKPVYGEFERSLQVAR
jgi:hypothetical protein